MEVRGGVFRLAVCGRAVRSHDGTEVWAMRTNGKGVGQIGGGCWGRNLLGKFSAVSNCRVKYVVDSSLERRAFVESNFPRTRAVDASAKALSDPDVTGVLVATPAGTHFQLAKEALLAGKHVFVEKPLATKVAEVDELERLAI